MKRVAFVVSEHRDGLTPARLLALRAPANGSPRSPRQRSTRSTTRTSSAWTSTRRSSAAPTTRGRCTMPAPSTGWARHCWRTTGPCSGSAPACRYRCGPPAARSARPGSRPTPALRRWKSSTRTVCSPACPADRRLRGAHRRGDGAAGQPACHREKRGLRGRGDRRRRPSVVGDAVPSREVDGSAAGRACDPGRAFSGWPGSRCATGRASERQRDSAPAQTRRAPGARSGASDRGGRLRRAAERPWRVAPPPARARSVASGRAEKLVGVCHGDPPHDAAVVRLVVAHPPQRR